MAAVDVFVPDVLENYPWKRDLNSHHESTSIGCREWLRAFEMFDTKSTLAFDKCDSPLLASLAFPYHDAERLRTAQDLMGMLYVFDQYTDVESPDEARALADMVMDALRNPDKPRPEGELAVGEFVRQFWQRGRKISTPMAERHFIESMQDYVDGVVLEVGERSQGRVHTVDEYLDLRQHTSGCLPSFALVEMELDFPEEVYVHPSLKKLRDLAMSSIFRSNDIYSYGVERARGLELHNMVTVAMHALDTGPQEAVDWMCRIHEEILAEFVALSNSLPSWGPEIDPQVRRYVHGLGCWIRGNDAWSFESERYFGKAGVEIQKHRIIRMLPRRADAAALPGVDRPGDFEGTGELPAALGINPVAKSVVA